MGIHYVNVWADRRPEARHEPEILLYEPQADGSLRLVGIEWMVLDSGQEKAPRSSATRGTFEQYNPNVSCAAADAG